MDKWLVKKSVKTTKESTDANNITTSCINVQLKSEVSKIKDF